VVVVSCTRKASTPFFDAVNQRVMNASGIRVDCRLELEVKINC
jgi:hypothetical protein